MKEKTIRIKEDTAILISELMDKYHFETINKTLSSVLNFIKKNDINVNADYKNIETFLLATELRYMDRLAKMEDKISRDYTSFRKWLGAVERDYFIPTTEKIKLAKFEMLEEGNDEISESPISPVKEENLLKEKINKMEMELKNEREKFNKMWGDYENETIKVKKQNEILNTVFSNAKAEQSMMGKNRIVIDLTVEKWNSLLREIK